MQKPEAPAHPARWWKEATLYQIYPRSFMDSNGDGIGDLNGIRKRLDHLKNLGADLIWLSPIYQSPNDDNGYDISDYRNIMTEFGTMADFEALLAEVHDRGMRLLLDLVVNHSSDEHMWFQESRKSKDNPYRDFYYWRPPVNGGPPNDWPSIFSGSAWELDELTGEYYLHLFTKKQPDLNWENPNVRKEVYEIMRFWLDKGIDGFRMDVIPFISKDLSFPPYDPAVSYGEYYANGPRLHEFLQEMNREVLAHYDMVSIGEGIGISPENANLYVGKNRNELDMVFHFGHMFLDHGPGGRFDPADISLEEFIRVFEEWDEALAGKGWGTLYLGNHDFPRMVSRFGDDGRFRTESAKLLATLLFTLRGTPTIYQGDEIGMTNTPFDSIDELKDVESHNAFREYIAAGGTPEEFLDAANKNARDHARTPMQWDSSAHAGFSASTPWMKVNPNFPEINVEDSLQSPDSILLYYQKLTAFRRQHPMLVYGEYLRLPSGNDSVYAYQRQLGDSRIWVLLNFSSEDQSHSLPENIPGELWLSNYADQQDTATSTLRPWEARVLGG